MLKRIELTKENYEYTAKLFEFVYCKEHTDDLMLDRFLEVLSMKLARRTMFKDAMNLLTSDRKLLISLRHPVRSNYVFDVKKEEVVITLDTDVMDLKLLFRTKRILCKYNCNSVKDLFGLKLTDVAKMKYLGKTSLYEIVKFIEEYSYLNE